MSFVPRGFPLESPTNPAPPISPSQSTEEDRGSFPGGPHRRPQHLGAHSSGRRLESRFSATRTVATLVREDEKLRAQPRASRGGAWSPSCAGSARWGRSQQRQMRPGWRRAGTRLRSAALAIKKQKGQSLRDASTGCPPGVRTLDQRPAGSRQNEGPACRASGTVQEL